MMWRKLWKLSVITVMVAGLTACSGKEGVQKEKPEQSMGSSENAKKQQETEQETEYVYQLKETEAKLGTDSVMEGCILNDRFYFSYSEYVPDETGGEEGSFQYYFASCDLNGNDVKAEKLADISESAVSFQADDQGKLRYVTQGDAANTVYTLDENGKVTEKTEIKWEGEDKSGYAYGSAVAFLKGKIYIAAGSEIDSFDEEGKAGKVYDLRGDNASSLCVADGKLYAYVSHSGSEGNYKEYFQEIDLETGKFGQASNFGDYSFSNGEVRAGKGSVAYIKDGSNLFSYDFSSGALTEEFNWLNLGMNAEYTDLWLPTESGFFAINNRHDREKEGATIGLVTVNKVNAGKVKEKNTLTLYTIALTDEMREEILAFNREQEDCCIEVVDYDVYEDPGTRLNLDLAAGKIPDIINAGSDSISMERLAKKGIFTDLYPLMEKDEDVNKEDFIPSVLKALEIDGKLYYMGSHFSINALVSGKDIVGDSEGWTMDEMEAAYKKMGKDAEFMDYMSAESWMFNQFFHGTEKFVDWTKGEVYFDSDEFKKILEFTKTLPTDEELMNSGVYNLWTDLLKEGNLFLNRVSMTELAEVQVYTKLYKKQGGPVVMSYPSEEKSSLLSFYLDNTAPAITEKCEDKEAAWEFVKRFLTYDHQKNADIMMFPFPTRQDAFEKKLTYAMAKKAYTDEDGTEVTPIDSGIGYDSTHIDLGPLTKKDAKLLRSIVNRAGVCVRRDSASEAIYDIITEEMGAFLAGDKTVEETAEIIQNRAKICVSENS